MTLFMRALSPIVFGLRGGPGEFLDEGEKIEADKVNEAYLDDLKAGGRNARLAELVELDEDEAGGPGDDQGSSEPQAHTPAGRTEDDNNERFDPTEHPVSEVLDHLKASGADEVARVKALEAENTKRASGPSAQVANYQPEA